MRAGCRLTFGVVDRGEDTDRLPEGIGHGESGYQQSGNDLECPFHSPPPTVCHL